MSTNVVDLIRQGIAALKSGNKGEARFLLNQAAELDPRSEEAWLWLSACVDSLENQQICLENVLAINPTNARARKGLDKIRSQLAAQNQPPAQAAPPLPASDPFMPPAGVPFGAMPPDPYGAPPSPPPSPATSPFTESYEDMDFVDELPSEPEASGGYHGSGSRAVVEPSATDLDDWVDSLNLGGGASSQAPATDDPFGMGAGPFQSPSFSSSPFGDDPFGVKEDFGFDAPPAPPEPLPAAPDNFAEMTSPTPAPMTPPVYKFDEQPISPIESSYQGYAAQEKAPVYGDLFGDEDEDSAYEDAGDLMKHFDFLPSGIKSTHLPGKAPVYPRGTVLGLVVTGLGSLAALLLLVLQLVM